MNPEIKSEWTTALKSGSYAQGVSVLRDGDSFCCLGVLCDIAVKHGVIRPPVLSLGHDVYGYGTIGDSVVLPPEVVEWAGLDDHSPSVRGDRLTNLNDSGTPFPEIASLIEENL